MAAVDELTSEAFTAGVAGDAVDADCDSEITARLERTITTATMAAKPNRL
ncbi:MAG: hypothetical protein WA761_03730 [Thermoplasmata archaeon]